MSKGWIGVDLDGCLASYSGWISPDHIGDAIPLMASRVNRWLAAGQEVRLVTARATPLRHPSEAAQFNKAWREWSLREFSTVLQVTACKDFRMIALYDDRAVAVETNTGVILGGIEP